MSRLKRFTRSVISGYLLLAGNMLYTFVSVPLALYYLSRAEFGLWSLTAQLAGYISLIDMGMSGSLGRILVDYKDKKSDGAYGSVIQTGALVGVSQGLLIFLAGSALAFAAGPLLHVQPDLQEKLTWLLVGQCAVTGFSFATRIFAHLLAAHQHYEVTNYGQAALFGLSLLIMWAGFAAGLGVFSFLLGQAVTAVVTVIINLWGCLRLKMFPNSGAWGRPTWERFKEVFLFGQDVFLFTLGIQFINASQTILLTRFLGLEVATIWSVCIRTYNVVIMVIWRIQDYSAMALAEMIVRGERERLLKRFRELAVVSGSLSVAAGTLLAVCNNTFVQLWTHGKVHWTPVNDLLVAVWLIIGTNMRWHIMLAGATKRFGFLRYLFIVEGLVFVGSNILLRNIGGMTGMLVLSILCTAIFSLPYGLRRTRRYFDVSGREVASWYLPTWQLAWRLVPLTFAVWWLARGWPLEWQLAASAIVPGTWGALGLLRHGLSKSIRLEIVERVPIWAKQAIQHLAAV